MGDEQRIGHKVEIVSELLCSVVRFLEIIVFLQLKPGGT